jgi:hypothetical protein
MPDRGDDTRAAPPTLLSAFNAIKELVAVAVVAVGMVVYIANLKSQVDQLTTTILEMKSHNIPDRVKTLEDNVPTALASVNVRFAADEAAVASDRVTAASSQQQLAQAATSATQQLQAELHEMLTTINGITNQITGILSTLNYVGNANPTDGKHVR